MKTTTAQKIKLYIQCLKIYCVIAIKTKEWFKIDTGNVGQGCKKIPMMIVVEKIIALTLVRDQEMDSNYRY